MVQLITSIHYSAGTTQESRMLVKQILGIEEAREAEKYLGIPTVWGRSKQEALGYLKDKIWNKMSGWKNIYLSNAGKQILLKAVITVILTYAMALFKLSKTWCGEMMAMMTRFWWSQSADKRSIHWSKWEYMTKPKALGGMGF